jgi:hypothetical protein
MYWKMLESVKENGAAAGRRMLARAAKAIPEGGLCCMGNIGILLYGYSRAQAERIAARMEEVLGRDVALLGASGGEDKTVDSLLEMEGTARFEERELRVLMFLGFDDILIARAMDHFPREEDLPRPIFCGLTEENQRWEFSHLLEHLLDEHRRWSVKQDDK